jgi:hypothetical protein
MSGIQAGSAVRVIVPAGFSKKPLAPNEESIISLTFHPKNRPGTIDAEATRERQ